MPRESIRCAAIGWSSPSIFHIICRQSATDIGEALSAISRPSARAAGNSSSGACSERTRPPSNASSAEKMRPVATHSIACCMPTRRGRNQEEAASITTPRREKTKPNRASVEARRISIGRICVAPKPTAGPFTAAITGFFMSKRRSATRPPPSRWRAPGSGRARSKVPGPPERSAPAQKARPAPVTMTARTPSSRSAASSASRYSPIMAALTAFSRSGRLSVSVSRPSSTSAVSVSYDNGASPRRDMRRPLQHFRCGWNRRPFPPAGAGEGGGALRYIAEVRP